MSLRQLPNAITVARALLVLPLVWSMREEHWRTAFWIAFAAGASDQRVDEPPLHIAGLLSPDRSVHKTFTSAHRVEKEFQR